MVAADKEDPYWINFFDYSSREQPADPVETEEVGFTVKFSI